MKTILSAVSVLALAACAATPADNPRGSTTQHDDQSVDADATATLALDTDHTFYVDLDRLAAIDGVSPDTLVTDTPDYGIVVSTNAMRSDYYVNELKPKLDALRGTIHDNSGANGDAFYYVAFPYSGARKRQLAIVRSIGDENDPSKPGGVFLRIRPDNDSDVRRAFQGGHFDFRNLVPNIGESALPGDFTLSKGGKDLVKISNIDFALDGFSMDIAGGNVQSAAPKGHLGADITLFPAVGNSYERAIRSLTKPFVIPAGPVPVEMSLTLELGFGIAFSGGADGAPTGLSFHVDAAFDGSDSGQQGQQGKVTLSLGSPLTTARSNVYLYLKADLALYEVIHAVAKIAAPSLYVVPDGCVGTPRVGLGFHSGFGAGLGAGALRKDWNVEGPGCLFWANTSDASATCAGNADGLMSALATRECPL